MPQLAINCQKAKVAAILSEDKKHRKDIKSERNKVDEVKVFYKEHKRFQKYQKGQEKLARVLRASFS